MNSKIKTYLTLSVVGVVALIVSASVFSVVYVESGDALRAIAVSTVLVSAVVLGGVLLYRAVTTSNKDAMLKIGGIMAIYFVILLAFVYFDYGSTDKTNLSAFDSRLRFIIVNAIWIPATFTALTFFYFYKKARELYTRDVPFGVRLLEYIVGISSFIGSAWGTFDAVYIMTQGDILLSLAMSISIDAMLFIMGWWHYIANDDVTKTVTLFGKGAYFVIALWAQIIDGGLRATGATSQNYSNVGWTALPFVIIGSGIFVGITYLIDKYYKGSSFEKPANNTRFTPREFSDTPQSRANTPYVGGRPMGYQPMSPEQSQSQRPEPTYRPQPRMDIESDDSVTHNAPFKEQPPQAAQPRTQSRFAEEGGLPREIVLGLKALGYSSRAIANMKLQEAQNRFTHKVAPRPDQRSGNFQVSENGNGQSKNPT